ncbi:MAG: sodium ion-translocating decarboxylase subunit beta, partial [Corallincola sp.]|nr:sodium ion-translocating decarboxylase subunit beta [Corallincola sp.]
MDGLLTLWQSTGIANFTLGQALMMVVGAGLLFLAIVKKFEPLLLLPIGFGAVLANIPGAGFTDPGGILYYVFYAGIETGVFPLLIFMGVGALTDFGALIANPKTLLLGAAAQFGIFGTLFGAIFLNLVPGLDFDMKQAAAIAIIGGADGPT